MVVGQEVLLFAKAFFIEWKVRVKVISINKKRQEIRYDVYNPFGFKNEEKLEYKVLDKNKCEVRYNCNFIFPDGIKGLITRTILSKQLIDVPEDSIKRLKTEAESEYNSRTKLG